MHASFAEHFIFWGELAGAVGTIGGLGYGVIRWLTVAYKKISAISENVVSISTNHLPHIQDAIDAHTAALQGIKSDVRAQDIKLDGLSIRMDDNRAAIYTLGASFLRHIEGASQEKVTKKRKR